MLYVPADLHRSTPPLCSTQIVTPAFLLTVYFLKNLPHPHEENLVCNGLMYLPCPAPPHPQLPVNSGRHPLHSATYNNFEHMCKFISRFIIETLKEQLQSFSHRLLQSQVSPTYIGFSDLKIGFEVYFSKITLLLYRILPASCRWHLWEFGCYQPTSYPQRGPPWINCSASVPYGPLRSSAASQACPSILASEVLELPGMVVGLSSPDLDSLSSFISLH